MNLVPLSLREANAYVREHHRHHKPVRGQKFSIGVELHDKLRGCAIVGRPVGRAYDIRKVIEVTRLVTDGTKNACSFLYAAAARAALAMGYCRIQTYILEDEPGTSLRAAGWRFDGMTPGRQWEHSSEKQLRLDGSTRRTDQPLGPKQRWVKDLAC